MELSTKKLDRDLIIVSYSLSENFLDQNTESILEISGDISNIEIIDLIVSDRRGNPVSSTLTHLENKNLPNTFSLDQNYPNPFNNLTSISYSVPQKSDVSLTVYDVLGNQVSKIHMNDAMPGHYSYKWNGKNRFGTKVASGVYIYRLKANNFISTKKMLLVK